MIMLFWMFKVLSQIWILVHKSNPVSNGFMKVSHPSAALRGKSSTSAFLNESEFIHSKDKAVSIQGSLNPGLTLSGLQSCLPPPQCLLFFYSRESPQHQSGPWECRDSTVKNFVKEPYRLHNRFFLGWFESNLLPILLSDTKGALPRHDYAEITFCKKLKPSRASGIPKPCFWPRGATGISQHIPSALFSDPNRAPLSGVSVFTVSLPGLGWPITSTKKRKHRGLRTRHDKTIKCAVGTALLPTMLPFLSLSHGHSDTFLEVCLGFCGITQTSYSSAAQQQTL